MQVSKITNIVVGVLLCAWGLTRDARADLYLRVDFDINAPGIQDTAIIDDNKTTAWVVMFLDGATDLYAYQFSVRYNSNQLSLIERDDSPPTSAETGSPYDFVETLPGDVSVSGSGAGFSGNYEELRRFDGFLDDPNDLAVITSANIPATGLILGILRFNVLGTDEGLIVMPGDFEPDISSDLKGDTFTGNAGEITGVSFTGGTIAAVPEPSSILLFSAACSAFAIRRRVVQRFMRRS